MLTLALISAGLGLAACGNVAFAASAPAKGTQDQTPSQTDQSSTNAQQTGQKNSRKETKKKEQQKPQYTQLQTVQVNGFISSIENSTALKRDANTIVEAVSAEQIGKLPGVSIADALGRLPGLAVQTVDGRPQVLSIHGLGPDFSTALVNGGQQVSTSNNRDVQFDQYPASWFQDVVVHLSPEADLIGQGLAGTVDMHTIRPLDQAGPVAAINAHYIWDSASQLASGPGVSDKGYNINGVFVDQFADHTLGVTLGVDAEHNPAQIEHQAP
ncbi:MAG TPA: TonB-dependent receptor plug domain-containing protein, partial [Rhodanobacteraceae bacterium]|nr:TonB-dependent receptor plug domain-containing protein [Rhodanobacteraceae bacterium]